MHWLSSLAFAATLPGIDLPFDVAADGRWVLAADLPDPIRAAGVAPGWILLAVDDLEVADGALARRIVADGPARDVRLRFQVSETPGDETILVARRSPLVTVNQVAVVTWPEGFVPVGGFSRDPHGNVLLTDRAGERRVFEPDDASFRPLPPGGPEPRPDQVPAVFWSLADAPWVVGAGGALDVQPAAQVRAQFGPGAHVPHFQGRAVDTLLLATPAGLQVFEVDFPSGTPDLPWCSASVPETCLASGRAALEELGDRPGASDLARDHLNLACEGGVHRACFEALAVREPDVAADARACTEGDLPACSRISTRRFEEDRAAASPTPAERAVTLGLLEFTCDLEGSGTLSERLRRIEDVGAACAQLSDVYDALAKPDFALLALDRSCVLGRAEACDRATTRRDDAYASKTVRECEDATNPIAPACVDLGRLLRDRPVPAATLDEFGAFLRGCSLGSAEGCLVLGDYVDRWGIDDRRVVDAETTLRAACDAGEMRSCLGAAHLLVRHEPRSDAYGEALLLFSKACEQGLGAACVAGADQRRIGQARSVEAPDPVGLLTIACDRSDPLGCENLGQRLAKRPDTTGAAYTAWTRACDLGTAHSCSELGMLVAGPHEPPWPGELPSRDYLVRGCEDGDPEGCFRLAEGALPKKGDPPESAYVLLSKSCAGEFAQGCARLADVHLERGTSFDEEIAAGHLDTACAHGDYDSCKGLGVMYLRGRGVERDRVKARELLEKFRLNAPMRFVRLGVAIGVPVVAGGELELAAPTPIGGLSVSGTFSQLPVVGAALPVLVGVENPDPVALGERATPRQRNPSWRYLGLTARLYPNPRARGLYGFAGFDRLEAFGGWLDLVKRDLPEYGDLRSGIRGGVGIRNDRKRTFSGLEAGIGYFGPVALRNFDPQMTGTIPLVQTVVTATFGVAPF